MASVSYGIREARAGNDHAGHHILAPKQANCFGLEARPRTSSKFAQQLAVEPSVQPKTFGVGQDDLPMRDGKTDFFSNVEGGQLCVAFRCDAVDVGSNPVGAGLAGRVWIAMRLRG